IIVMAFDEVGQADTLWSSNTAAFKGLPKALAEKIDQKMKGFILINNAEKNEQTTDEYFGELFVLLNPSLILI
ncbi:hypothetical protein ABTH45_19280, partial [Acinetobacter baumannii]